MKNTVLLLCLFLLIACGKQAFEHPSTNITMAKSYISFNEAYLKGIKQGIEKHLDAGKLIPDKIKDDIYYTELLIEDLNDIVNGFLPDGAGIDYKIKDTERFLADNPLLQQQIDILKKLKVGQDVSSK